MLLPFLPAYYVASYTGNLIYKAHEYNVELQQKLFPSLLENKLTVLQTKLKLLVAASKETTADIHAKLGLLFLLKGHSKTAMEHIERAILMVPNHYLYYYFKGLIAAKVNRKTMRENFEEAIKHLDYQPPKRSRIKQLLHGIDGLLSVKM